MFLITNKGDLIRPHHVFIGNNSSMLAEVKALRCGLEYALQLSISHLWIEMESLELIHILRGKSHCPWHIHYYIRYIRSLLSDITLYITHIFREGNKVADGLANEAIDKRDRKNYEALTEFPRYVYGVFLLDRASLPGVRGSI